MLWMPLLTLAIPWTRLDRASSWQWCRDYVMAGRGCYWTCRPQSVLSTSRILGHYNARPTYNHATLPLLHFTDLRQRELLCTKHWNAQPPLYLEGLEKNYFSLFGTKWPRIRGSRSRVMSRDVAPSAKIGQLQCSIPEAFFKDHHVQLRPSLALVISRINRPTS